MVTFYLGENQDAKESYEKFEDSNAENGIKLVRFFVQFLTKRGTKALIEEQEAIQDAAIAALNVKEEGDHGYEELLEERDTAIEEIERLVTEALDIFEQLLGAALVSDWNETCRKMLETTTVTSASRTGGSTTVPLARPAGILPRLLERMALP